MDQNTYYVYSDELYHYGRKGMKWGQHIFGKPRSGSKGRVVAKKKSLLDKAKEAKAAKQKAKAEAAEAERKRQPQNMSDDELRKAIARKQLENQYRQYYPAKVNKGKEFAKKVWNESVSPALLSSGKKIMGDLLDNYGKNLVKKYFPEELTEQQKLDRQYEKVKKQHDILDYKDKIDKIKNPKKSNQDRLTELQNEKKIKDLLDTDYQDLIRQAAEAKLRQTISGNNNGKNKKDEDED